LKTSLKVCLSIPSILVLVYVWTFVFPEEFQWLVPSMNAYYTQLSVLQGLRLIQVVILIKKLMSFKTLEKSKKSDWVWYLIIFNTIACLIFIWKKMDEFERGQTEKKIDVA